MFCGGFEAIKAETDENGCEVITYYSRKEWVKYYDFFDSDFENATEFTNSRMISANLNGFGPYSFERPGAGIYSVSYDNFTGKSPMQVYGTGEHEEFYSTFMVTFGSKIRILDMDIGVSIKDAKGNEIPYKVYVKTDKGLMVVYEGIKTGINNLQLSDMEIDEILIRASNPSNDNLYELKYFKINSYEIYEHVSWSKDYIENTETETKTFCKGDGKFMPSEGLEYAKSYNVGFIPSIRLINDQIDYSLVDSWLRYNDGLKIGINKGSLPDYTNMYLWNGADRKLTGTFGITPSNKPFTWKVSGNHYTGISKTSNTPYIETNKTINNRKVYFRVDADAIRCQGGNCAWYFLGGGKYDGHGSNRSDNAFDTYVKTYTKEPADGLNYIAKISYYLLDDKGNRLRKIDEVISDGTNDLENSRLEYEINESGIFMIEAELTNALNDTKSIRSGLFYVDNEAPQVYFDPDHDVEDQNSISVIIKVDDNLSGIDKWRYRFSQDNGLSYGEYSPWIYEYYDEILISSSGKNVIAVEAMDKAGNAMEYKSPQYSIRSSKPLIYAKTNYYLKGDEVTALKLLENASAFDEADGDISDRIIIKKIEYEDGRVDENVVNLNTEKVQSFYITYEVSNSFNVSNQKRKKYEIVENESMAIDGEDLMIYNRYISKEYLGSLKDISIWKINDEYKRKLVETFDGSDIKYHFIIE